MWAIDTHMRDLSHLHMSYRQLRHLMDELSGHHELYWLTKAIQIPLDTEKVRTSPFYKDTAWLVHKLKPNFPRWLQDWLSIYFTVYLSDGFEDGTLNAWTGGQQTDGTSTIAPTNTLAHSGSWSCKSTTAGAPATNEYAITLLNFSPAVVTIYIRAYIYLNIAIPTNYATPALMGTVDTVNNREDLFFVDTGGTVNIRQQCVTDGAGAFTFLSGDAVTLNATTWYCLEYGVFINAGAGFEKAWLDGSLVLSRTGVDNTGVGTPGWDPDRVQAEIGQNDFPADGNEQWGTSRQIYHDDVIISDVYNGPMGAPAEGTFLTCLAK